MVLIVTGLLTVVYSTHKVRACCNKVMYAIAGDLAYVVLLIKRCTNSSQNTLYYAKLQCKCNSCT